ncbi:unnamed protein product [Cuscuta epithymum]|nr:unnamed protein product [Cuscuta epithymum]
MLQNLFPTSELMSSASRLILHLHEKGIPISVATGSHKRHFQLKTKQHDELFSLMHHIVVGDDPEVKQGKPSPDIFLTAAKNLRMHLLICIKFLFLRMLPQVFLLLRMLACQW